MCVYGFINEGTLVENLILWLWTGNISIESGKVVFNLISFREADDIIKL